MTGAWACEIVYGAVSCTVKPIVTRDKSHEIFGTMRCLSLRSRRSEDVLAVQWSLG